MRRWCAEPHAHHGACSRGTWRLNDEVVITHGPGMNRFVLVPCGTREEVVRYGGVGCELMAGPGYIEQVRRPEQPHAGGDAEPG